MKTKNSVKVLTSLAAFLAFSSTVHAKFKMSAAALMAAQNGCEEKLKIIQPLSGVNGFWREDRCKEMISQNTGSFLGFRDLADFLEGSRDVCLSNFVNVVNDKVSPLKTRADLGLLALDACLYRGEMFLQTDLKACTQMLDQFRTSKGLPPLKDHGLSICIQTPAALFQKDSFKASISFSVSSVASDFFYNDWYNNNVMNGKIDKNKPTDSFDRIDDLIRVSKKDRSLKVAPENTAVILDQFHYHSNSNYGTNMMLGGVSGITRSENPGEFTIVEDLNNAKQITLNSKFEYLSSSKIEMFEKETRREIKNYGYYDQFTKQSVPDTYKDVVYTTSVPTDWEDIQFVKENKYLVSGEMPINFTENVESMSKPKDGSEPKKVVTKRVTKTLFGIFDKEKNTLSPLPMVAGFFGAKPKKDFDNNNFYDNRQYGLVNNNGIEGLSVDPVTQSVWFSSERALGQDSERKVRLTNMQLAPDLTTWKEVGYFAYEVDKAENATETYGVVAMQSLSASELLVMERYFDFSTQQASIRIYLVNTANEKPTSTIEEDSGSKVSKKLVLDLKNVSNQIAAGLEKIDNFEGMMLLEHNADTATVILVSDNNGRANQATSFLKVRLNLPRN